MIHTNCSISKDRYLERIGFSGPLEPTFETLSALQEAHLKSVPYENLDILYGNPLSLEIPDLFQKIVINRRGGYCFELNALFRWLLIELSFSVTSYMARFLKDEPEIPMRRHHVLRVNIGGVPYLADVGVGGPIPLRPLPILEGLEHVQEGEAYRFQWDSFLGWVLEEYRKEAWLPLYSFTEEEQLPIDFIMPSYYCEHSTDSIFRKQAMVSLRIPNGRVTVADKEFRIFTSEGVQTFVPETEQDLRDALKQHFGIVQKT